MYEMLFKFIPSMNDLSESGDTATELAGDVSGDEADMKSFR